MNNRTPSTVLFGNACIVVTKMNDLYPILPYFHIEDTLLEDEARSVFGADNYELLLQTEERYIP